MSAEGGEESISQQRKFEEMLTTWLTAVALFHYQYTQLSCFLSEFASHALPTTAEGLWVGQCPIGQLKDLLCTMQQELKKLFGDADQFDSSSVPQSCQMLSTHTQLLDQLNQQAQNLLGLASLRAC